MSKLEFVAIAGQTYAVRRGDQRVGTAWRAVSGGWRYSSLDGRIRRTAYSLTAIKRSLAQLYPADENDRARRSDAVVDLRCCW